MADLLSRARPGLRKLPGGVQNALRFLAHPRRQRRVLNDLAGFRNDMRPIVDALRRKSPAIVGEVLIHSVHGFVPSLKEDALLGAILLSHGQRPVYLTTRSDGLDRYLRVIPGARFIYWDEYISDPTADERAAAARMVADARTMKALVETEQRGIAIGRHALSWLMRTERVGALDLDAHRGRLIEHFARSLAAARSARAVLDRETAASVLMNERGYTPYGEFFDEALARGRRAVQYVGSHRDDARIFKAYTTATRTLHPNSLSAESWAEALRVPFGDAERDRLLGCWESLYASGAWFNRQRLQHRAKMLTREETIETLGLDPRKPTAVLFSHIFWDATFFYGESLYDDYQQWFVETVRLANRATNVNWVVKLHPVNVWRLAADGVGGQDVRYAEIAALHAAGITVAPHVKMLMPDTSVSTWSLFQVADYGFTVRGTVGIELAALGKRVVTAGTGHYAGRGFTTDPEARAEYERIVMDPSCLPPVGPAERERALRYGHYLLERKPYRFDTHRFEYSAEPNVVHAFNGRPRILAGGKAFMESVTGERWARWMTASSAEDCLAIE